MPSSNRKKKLLVFLSHANEDKPAVRELYHRLIDDGLDPWLDEERLLPGQDWHLEIEQVMRKCEAILLCFSEKSISKEGYVHREYKKAMDLQQEKPTGTIFVIPVRLDECEIPFFLRELQCVDYPSGYEKLVTSLNVRAEKVSLKKKASKSAAKDRNMTKAIGSKEKVRQVQLVLEGAFEEFNETRQKDLVSVLASILRVDSESIRILQVYSGSIVIVAEMPKIAANRLIKFAKNRDFRLRVEGIISIQAEGEPTILLSDAQLAPPFQINVQGGNMQFAIGDRARNIQTQTYIEKIIVTRPTMVMPRSLYQLRPSPADFTGREKELGEIFEKIERYRGAVISGLTGFGGIGKTALGLVIAHELAEKYSDAQIFLDLKGTTTLPLTTLETLRHVILSIEPNINVRDFDEEGIIPVYQSILHNKKILIFLDNARSADQVMPLIPPETCALLITSRWIFNIAGIQSYSVDVLTENDAKEFLLTLCPRIAEKAGEIAQACRYLPLALRIAGNFLQVNENWEIDKYLALLNDPKYRLATIETSRQQIDLGKEPSLVATFDLSYQQLEEDEQTMWQMLSTFQHPFNWQEASGLWEKDEDATLKLLGMFRRYSLVDYNEVSKTYNLHDLLVDYGLWRIEQAIINSKQTGSAHGELKWTMFLAVANKNASDFNNSIELYKQALTLARKISDQQVEATILNGLGILYREIGEHKLAMKSHEEALAIAQAIGNPRNELSALTGLGNEHHALGESRLSIEYIEKAHNVAQEIGDQTLEAKLLNNLANSYEDFDPLHAIDVYEEALKIAQEVGDRLTEGNVLTNAGIAYYETNDYDKALDYHKRAQAIFEDLKDLDGVGATLGNAGNCYLELGQIDQAIDCYSKFLSIARQTYYRNGEANALGNLGRGYEALGKLDEAQEYFEAQLKITKEIGDRVGEGNSLDNIGDLYITRNQPDRAISYIDKALVIFREISDKSGEGYALWNLGKANKVKGNLEKAKLLGNEALQILEPIESQYVPRIKKWLSEIDPAN